MIQISDDFMSDTLRVRKSGTSLIIGLDKTKCKYLKIEDGSMIRVFYEKMRDMPKEEQKPEMNEVNSNEN